VTRAITIEANRETKVDLDPPRAVAVRDQAPPPHPSGGSSSGSSSGSSGGSPAVRQPPADPSDHGAAGARPRSDDRKPRGDATKPPAEPGNSDGASAKPAIDLVAIRAAARSQLRPVVQCYERGKMEDSNLRGNVTVRITIAADGSVASAQVASSTLGAPEVEACITHEVGHWQLPGPAGGIPVSLSYPIVFE
jgi:TonB family protein